MLLALEQAPRYREAHRLLLDLKLVVSRTDRRVRNEKSHVRSLSLMFAHEIVWFARRTVDLVSSVP